MTQFSTVTNEFLNTNKSIYEVYMGADRYGYTHDGIGGTLVDAFGRVRVGNPYTLFEASARFQVTNEKFSTANAGTSSVTFSEYEGCANLSIGTASGDYVYRETKRVFAYQPGKSLQVLNTFTFAPAQTNLRQRIGYFGANNGIYLEQTDGVINMVKRSQVSGTIVNTAVPQSQWNVDKFDGAGPSGAVLDMTKSQIFWMDIEWLGVGTVRTGFVINGSFCVAHKFHHANMITGTYMTTACLPIRLEIENTGTNANSSIMKQICHSVVSEGGYSQVTTSRSASTPITGKTLSNGIKNPMVSIRLRSGRTDSIVIPSMIDVYGLQATAYKYYILKDVTSLGNVSWQQTDTASSIDYDVSANTITGGTVVHEGVFKGTETIQTLNLTEMFNHTLQLTREINASNGNIFTVAIEPTTNNDKAITSLSWQEHTL